MDFQAIKTLIISHFGQASILSETEGLQPCLQMAAEQLPAICEFLHRSPHTYFDFLSCITGIDNGIDKNTMEVIYHLYSIPYGHSLVLRVLLLRNTATEPPPTIPTISHIWAAANWHERETYDLLGIVFEGHPDLRRILLPANWEGFPLRKDYKEADTYHGIKIKYEKPKF